MTETLTFGSLEIAFDDRVLRPRPWTAAQSSWAAEIATSAPDGPVLELCSGAGQIGLLAVAGSTRRLVCVDSSDAACDLARANARAADMSHRVEVRHSALETALETHELFPVVIADPPWVTQADTGRYPEDPLVAIDGGEDGLDVARACVRVIRAHLSPAGSAVLQLGTIEQAERLANTELPVGGPLELVEVRQHERGVLARIDRRPIDTP